MWERESVLDGVECAGYAERCGLDTVVVVEGVLEGGRVAGTCDGGESAGFVHDAEYCCQSGSG